MPVMKPISGHTKSVRAAIDYLTKKERALAADYVNCSEVDRRGRPTWRQMDETRHALGCDTTSRGHKRVRTYEHFILSPDPKDDVSLEVLRDLAREWVKAYFGSFQCVIYYHDDNELHIPHAHVIVNNADLNGHGRVSTMLTPRFVSEINLGLQRMAAERGLHAFTGEATSVNYAEWAKAQEKRSVPERQTDTAQPTYRTKRDKEIEAKSASWKQDVRDRMACAMRIARTEEEFVECCHALGLGVRVSESKRNRGEYVYRHPSGESREVSGLRLGRDWSRWGIQRRLACDREHGVAKPGDEGREKLLAAISALAKDGGGMALQVIGTTKDVPVTARDVADMLDVCGKLDVRSMADFGEALREPMPPAERNRVRDAMALCGALGYLPRERDKVDGRRTSTAQRRRMRGLHVNAGGHAGPAAKDERVAGEERPSAGTQRDDALHHR